MAATLSIITAKIGEGGEQHGLNVRRIQQLLRLAKIPVDRSGHWSPKMAGYVNAFRASTLKPDFYMADQPRDDEPKNHVSPTDPVLFELAYAAGVLIPLGVGWNRGKGAFVDVQRNLERRDASWVNDRVAWGLEGFPSWGIITMGSKTGKYEFPDDDPTALNCTTYANLMMSVWAQGNAHGPPYSAGVADSGNDKHLAKLRYGYPLIGKFDSLAAVTAQIKRPDKLYCIEAAYDSGEVHHIGLLLENFVYECNVIPKLGVQKRPLSDWLRSHTPVWLLGPAPT